jgi:adenylate cyclase class IV
MSTKNIEVELRGPLNETEYQQLKAFLQEQGALVKIQNRFLLDFSTFLEGIGERKLDVRARVTNGKVELIVKKGKFGGTSREEASIFPSDTLEGTLKFMSLLGYSKAVACDRGIERYKVGDIEVAIQDVRNFSQPGTIHSRFFEAEIMADVATEKAATEQIRDFLKKQGLREFSENEWNEYVAKMNNEANGVFNCLEDDIALVADLGKQP